VMTDGSVHMLDVGAGSLKRLADNRDDFAHRIDEDDNANHWLMIPLVDQLVQAGRGLKAGECYSYWQLPLLGGDYTVENTKVVTVEHHYKAFGPIHERLKDVPDGTRIQFKVERDG